MKTLTIEHLKGYLGTDLKYDISDTEYGKTESKRLEYCILKGISIVGNVLVFKTNILAHNRGTLHLNLGVGKPLLYPLSTLTEFREDLGFVPIEKIYDLMGWEKEELKELIEIGDILGIYSDLDLIPYSHAQKLYEWHIDIHGLIERGLAIDKTKI